MMIRPSAQGALSLAIAYIDILSAPALLIAARCLSPFSAQLAGKMSLAMHERPPRYRAPTSAPRHFPV
jgi:hypothetical protein